MGEMKFLHHRCNACKPLAHRDGYDLYHCDQPRHHKPTPVLVAVYENEKGERKELLCLTAKDAKQDELFVQALDMANQAGWYLRDQAEYSKPEEE